MSKTFEDLTKISVSDKTEKKGKFTYLSWVYAWSEIKKIDEKASVTVYHDERTNLPYFSSSAGVIVKVGVTVHGLEHISYLPCMDFSNRAKPEDKVDMMDVNKAIQRATVKAIALHGLGLYIYAGEDLPEGEEPKQAKKPTPESSSPSPASFKRKPKTPATTSVSDDI